jgi:hypothetical protein
MLSAGLAAAGDAALIGTLIAAVNPACRLSSKSLFWYDVPM